ncbi:hypothetical protein TraAM80_10455 [Trypanosoma rangeli]|uniref:Uncharacterized protein n=1 Tax=Trypanosoma rangeli TaxID=5698 RepID=A0A422MP57_TRYRA|nr:uncharacterized protein TraAM80_10455 [Trypanosoma rangeli]RNE94999.1 hypothetical protein TraAM80_10455 [Trypanosoma rangeli]|eukprot:RNE94999.1 hypothetical protein TraAM80_10455 [Trypanosoma rangeli]
MKLNGFIQKLVDTSRAAVEDHNMPMGCLCRSPPCAAEARVHLHEGVLVTNPLIYNFFESFGFVKFAEGLRGNTSITTFWSLATALLLPKYLRRNLSSKTLLIRSTSSSKTS